MFLERYDVFCWIIGLIAERNRPEYVDAVDWTPQVFLSVQEYGRQFQEAGKPLDLLAVRWDCGDGLVDVTVIHGLRDAGEASQGGGRCVVQVAAGN